MGDINMRATDEAVKELTGKAAHEFEFMCEFDFG